MMSFEVVCSKTSFGSESRFAGHACVNHWRVSHMLMRHLSCGLSQASFDIGERINELAMEGTHKLLIPSLSARMFSSTTNKSAPIGAMVLNNVLPRLEIDIWIWQIA
jgi:hypothetical protein